MREGKRWRTLHRFADGVEISQRRIKSGYVSEEPRQRRVIMIIKVQIQFGLGYGFLFFLSIVIVDDVGGDNAPQTVRQQDDRQQ